MCFLRLGNNVWMRATNSGPPAESTEGRGPDSATFVVKTRGRMDFPKGLLTRATKVKVSVVALGNLGCLVYVPCA